MRLIDANAIWDIIEKNSYPVYHGVGFGDVDYGMTVDGIRQCIDEVSTMNQWISVNDRLPKKEGDYWTVCKHRNGNRWTAISYYEPSYGWDVYEPSICRWGIAGEELTISGITGWSEINVTHWMKLPELPKELAGDD